MQQYEQTFPSENLEEELWNWQKNIAAFILDGSTTWVVDYKQHFILNARTDLDASLSERHISKDKHQHLLQNFRGGITELNSQNVGDYLASTPIDNPTASQLHAFFFKSADRDTLAELHAKVVESGFGALSEPEKKQARVMSVKLPSFFLDFDSKVYRHTDYDRMHHQSVHEDWNSKASSFWDLLPPEERYWVAADGRDYSIIG